MKFLATSAVTAVLAAALLGPVPARAQEYPWCAQYGSMHGGRNCGFVSYRQCMAALWGNGGWCERNLFARGPDPRWHAEERRERRYRR